MPSVAFLEKETKNAIFRFLLIAGTKADRFLRELIKEVQNADVNTLGRERNLAEVFKFVKDYADNLNITFTIPDSPKVTIALLHSATTKSRTN